MHTPKILTIVGPTAVGKTKLAIELAKKFDGIVISADSRQIYKEMPIGTGQPEGVWSKDGEEDVLVVETVPHYGIDIVRPSEKFTTADFKKYAEAKIDAITKAGKLPIIVGGTGLYLWALLDNLPLGGNTPDASVRLSLDAQPLDALVSRLVAENPELAQKIDLKNKRRVIRAIEIATSVTPQKKTVAPPPSANRYNVLRIGLTLPRAELYKNIEARIDGQLAAGFEGEAKKLFDAFPAALPSLSGIGYSNWAAYFAGEATRDETIRAIKFATRHYAKRQETWFKRDKKIKWFLPADGDGIAEEVKKFMASK